MQSVGQQLQLTSGDTLEVENWWWPSKPVRPTMAAEPLSVGGGIAPDTAQIGTRGRDTGHLGSALTTTLLLNQIEEKDFQGKPAWRVC